MLHPLHFWNNGRFYKTKQAPISNMLYVPDDMCIYRVLTPTLCDNAMRYTMDAPDASYADGKHRSPGGE